MPELPDVAHFTLAPDWVCEVISPSTEAIDRSDKMDIYVRESVRHVWMIDPIAKTLALDGATYRLLKAWREIALADLWQR